MVSKAGHPADHRLLLVQMWKVQSSLAGRRCAAGWSRAKTASAWTGLTISTPSTASRLRRGGGPWRWREPRWPAERSSCRSALNWAATKRDLGGELGRPACAGTARRRARPDRITMQGLCAHRAVLRAAEAETRSAHSASSASEQSSVAAALAERRPVQVQAEVAGVARSRRSSAVRRACTGAELGRLGQGDHAGLGPVVVAPSGQLLRDELRGDLPVRGVRHQEELGADAAARARRTRRC